METYTQYQEILKPAWAPPAGVFGPVWTVLYFLIAVSFITVFHKVYKKELPKIVALPFVLNIVFNLLFTPLQFGLNNMYLASADIVLVLVTLIWAMLAVYRHIRWVALINIPYLLWVIFATVLQIYITILNK